MRRASAAAPGKVILLGEHAVVHGQPAIVASIERGVRVTVVPRPGGATGTSLAARDPRLADAIRLAARLSGVEDGFDVEVEGDLPVAMGLGSSAALAVALLRALAASTGRALDDASAARNAHEIERLFHGTPSGVDGTAAAYGGVLWFEAGREPGHARITLAAPLPLLVVLSRTPHTTARTVGGLRERAARSPAVYRPVLAAIGELVAGARGALERGDRALLGELMTMNHGLLRACGVSTAELDAIVECALQEGALGAKLTGAGGGGAVVALPGDDGTALLAALRSRGHEGFVARLGIAGGAAVC
jgi:mevalonate kinase